MVNFAKKGEFSWKSLIFILVYATITATGLALFIKIVQEKVTMFRTYQKNDFAYFVSLIFLVFPIYGEGVWWVFSSVWTIVLVTGLFTIAGAPDGVFEKSLYEPVDSLSVVSHSSLHYLYDPDLPGGMMSVYFFQRQSSRLAL
ncbi:MAG: hypothetical protein ACLTYH_07875 [Streptococcus salivarius]